MLSHFIQIYCSIYFLCIANPMQRFFFNLRLEISIQTKVNLNLSIKRCPTKLYKGKKIVFLQLYDRIISYIIIIIVTLQMKTLAISQLSDYKTKPKSLPFEVAETFRVELLAPEDPWPVFSRALRCHFESTLVLIGRSIRVADERKYFGIDWKIHSCGR